MNVLRTGKLERQYLRDKKTGRCNKLQNAEPLKSYKYFKLIKNNYPHDKIAEVHNMLIPKRVVKTWQELRWYELREFKKLDYELSKEYDCIKRNYPSLQSVPEILHWHLYKVKR